MGVEGRDARPDSHCPELSRCIRHQHRYLHTTIGTALPSFLIILAIAVFFSQFKDNRYVAAIFRGIRPAVVALIAVPTFRLGQRAQLNRYTIWIPVVCALAIWALGVSPIYIIIVAALAGYLYGRLK